MHPLLSKMYGIELEGKTAQETQTMNIYSLKYQPRSGSSSSSSRSGRGNLRIAAKPVSLFNCSPLECMPLKMTTSPPASSTSSFSFASCFLCHAHFTQSATESAFKHHAIQFFHYILFSNLHRKGKVWMTVGSTFHLWERIGKVLHSGSGTLR